MNDERIVHCARYNEDLPGLEKPPLKGEVGQMIFDRVSKRAWTEWRDDLQMKVLNEYRLNMADSKDHKFMMEQMLLFLNLKEGSAVEVGNEARGRQE